MDPQNGEISRAMRNRSVEFFVSVDQQWNTNPPDVAAVTSSPSELVSLKVTTSPIQLSVKSYVLVLEISITMNNSGIRDALLSAC